MKTSRKQAVLQDRFISSRLVVDFKQNFYSHEPINYSKELDLELPSELNEDILQNKLYDVLIKSQILRLKHNPQFTNTQKLAIREGYLAEELNPALLFNETISTQNQINSFSLSPISGLDTPYPLKGKRIIPKVPYKVLDAPELQDDYYLDVVSWSKENVLAVGLGKALYLWVASNSKVIKLKEFAGNDSVTSVAWSPEGELLALGSHKGFVHVWDYKKNKEIFKSKVHSSRIGTISWHPHSLLLSTGSRDRAVSHTDIKMGSSVNKSIGHKQEVCGVRWSLDGQYLSSGGNDNKVLIWNQGKLNNPSLKFNQHKAAVKAMAWSRYQNGLLATGGGTTDRCIKLWDITTGRSKGSMDTGSQVCNMIWGVNSNELVTTHGYSNNHIAVWKFNPLKCIAQLTGHYSRVVYLSMSPDGESIVTGSGDETLRFWQVFPASKYKKEKEEEWEVYPSQVDIR
jgi:cell division cycle 20-like protein 1 (cofactor of APC complex)